MPGCKTSPDASRSKRLKLSIRREFPTSEQTFTSDFIVVINSRRDITAVLEEHRH